MSLDTLTCANCGTSNFPSNLTCKSCGHNIRTGERPSPKGAPAGPLRLQVPKKSEDSAQQEQELYVPSLAALIGQSPALTMTKRVILGVVWLCVIGVIFFSCLNYLSGMARAETVFQQITVIADSMFWVIAAYCFARAVTQITVLD